MSGYRDNRENDAPQNPAGGSDSEVFLGLLDSAELFGGFAWMERSLFEVLGSWSVGETDPAISVKLDDHSRRHFWHSRLWFERLPQLVNVDAEGLVRPSGRSSQQIIEDLMGLETTVDRLVGGYRVMCAHLLTEYHRVAQTVDPVSAPSVLRWLGFIMQDLQEQWLWGESTLRRLVATPEHLGDVVGVQQRLEERLLRFR